MEQEKKQSKSKASKKLPQIYVGEEKMSIAETVKAQIGMLALPTPDKYIMQRKGRGGLTLDYVEANYVIGRLNATFIFDWDSEVLSEIIDKESNQIAMKVRLKVRFANGKEVKKDAWGGSEIKRLKEDKSIIDLADDLKSAESDAIKKAASMLGMCWDVYAGLTGNGKSKKRQAKKSDQDIGDMANSPDGSWEKADFRTIPMIVDGERVVMTKFEALNVFKAAKKALGEKIYYEILGEHGFEKSNEIPPQDMLKINSIMVKRFQEIKAEFNQ